jgi:Holliday junction resolvase-like predicted endonuclease
MPLFARIAFAAVTFAARKGLAAPSVGDSDQESGKHQALRTGVRGETYAYWYLRRHGYVLVARNYMSPGMKGEIDLIGYDGRVLAFVEVKTRTAKASSQAETPAALLPPPEQAVNWEKRRNLKRMASQFLRARRVDPGSC